MVTNKQEISCNGSGLSSRRRMLPTADVQTKADSFGRSLSEQFFDQRSFQHHAFGSHTNTDSDTERNTNGNTYRHSYWNSNGNADTECYTNSDGYSYGDADGHTDNYAEADAHTKARTNAKASSVTAAETVGGSLPLSDERLLHGRNSGRKTQFVWSDY